MAEHSVRQDEAHVLGVGLIGAGPVAQAIHLPTLARLRSLFRIVSVMDVDGAVASTVADRAGARTAGTVEELLADPDVDVVAVCSPHAFHAEQVIAACLAGKRAVLCEKPLATDLGQAEAIADAARETGVPVIVGAMHAYDPGWTAALAEWNHRPARFLRSSIVLPPNERFETLATELFVPAAPAVERISEASAGSADVRGGVLGLAIHDIPLLRSLLPSSSEVTVKHAQALHPFGYLILLEIGGVVVELHAMMSDNWEPSWTLEAVAADAELEVGFRPSYVHAGSSSATLRRAGAASVTLGPFAANGYESEWRALHRAAVDGTRTDMAALVEDLRLALMIADGTDLFLSEKAVASEMEAVA